MGILDFGSQVIPGKRSGQQLHIGVTVRFQVLHGVFVDALEQENADLILLKRSIGHDSVSVACEMGAYVNIARSN